MTITELRSQKSLRNNAKVIDNARSSLAAISGTAAGIMGLQGWLNGILFYAATSCVLSVLMWYKLAYGDSKRFYLGKSNIWLEGVSASALSYLLFWTLAYGLVYVYE